jgi:DNA repair exonuclease SbcCD ATPase subunit
MKLEISNVKFKNFLSYGKIVQDIDFLPGINLVLGFDPEKERSNTSGKSSFLSTVPFALFGRVGKDIKKDQIVNWKNKKNCEVILTFKLDNIEYKILRAIKPDKLEIYKNDDIIPFADVKSYQKQFEEEILKIDYNSFISLFNTNLNSMVPILRMSKPQKRSFLETVFDLDFSDLNNICTSKLKSLDDRLNQIKISEEVGLKTITQMEYQNSDIFSKMSSINLDRLKAKMEDISEKEKKFKNFKSEEISDLQVDRKENWEEIENLKSELQKIDTEYGIISNKNVILNKRISELSQSISGKPDLIKDKEEYDRMGSIEDIEIKIESLEKQRDDYQEKIKATSKDLQNLREDIARLESKLEDIQSRDKKLEGKEYCPLCGSELKNTDIIDHIKKNVSILENDISVNLKRRDEITKDLSYLQNELDVSVRDLTSFNNKRTRLLKLGAKIEELKFIESKEEELNGLKENINDVDKKIKEISVLKDNTKKSIQKYKAIVDELDKKIEELKLKFDDINNISREKEILQIKINEQQSIFNNFNGILTENNKKIKDIQEIIRKENKEKERLESIYDYIGCIKDLCKDEHVKQYAISSMMPSLNKLVNYYLSESGMNFYIKLDKWLDETIEGPGISNCSYGSLSGGESRSIDLALQFGFLDVKRIKAGVYPDILILDELLDSSVDSIGLSNILDIVKVRQKEDNNKVFIITHRQEVNDLDVDNIYNVNKSDGFSYVSLK